MSCSGRDETPGAGCTYHICRRKDGHKGPCECICGKVWTEEAVR